MARTSSLDSHDIGKRAAEIGAERLRNITQCQCKRPDGGGEVDRSQCPIHRDPLQVEGCCLAPVQQQRVPEDDWETMKKHAQRLEATFFANPVKLNLEQLREVLARRAVLARLGLIACQ